LCGVSSVALVHGTGPGRGANTARPTLLRDACARFVVLANGGCAMFLPGRDGLRARAQVLPNHAEPGEPHRDELLLADVHDAGHERMHGAVVGEIAFIGEDMLELVVGIETLRGKALVSAGYRMRRFVVIGPDDLGAGGDRDFLRRVRELRDVDGGRGRSGGGENRRHDEGCAQDQGDSGGGAKQMGAAARTNVAHGTVLVGM